MPFVVLLIAALLLAAPIYAAPIVVATLDVERGPTDSQDIGPSTGLQVLLAVARDGGTPSLDRALLQLDSPWVTAADIGVAHEFAGVDVAAFVALLVDATDSALVVGRRVGAPTAYNQSYAVFPAFPSSGSVALESQVFGAPDLPGLIQRATIERADFTLTAWGGNGREWAGTFTFYTPEPSTAVLLGAGLAVIARRRLVGAS